jgi:hypothetical protein
MVFTIYDEFHCELEGDFASFDDAVAALVKRAKIPWNEEPNRAPCTSWKTCGRIC